MNDDLRGAREIAEACMRHGVPHTLTIETPSRIAFVDLPADASSELRADLIAMGATVEDQDDGTIRARVLVASQPSLELT